jgi:hypothetical protein
MSRRDRHTVAPRTRPRAGVANNTLETYEFENVLILNLLRPRPCRPLLVLRLLLLDQMQVIALRRPTSGESQSETLATTMMSAVLCLLRLVLAVHQAAII